MKMLKAIPAIVISIFATMAVPILAQSPQLGNSCTLWHIRDRSESLYQVLQDTLRTEELAGMRIAFNSMPKNSAQHTQYVREEGLSLTSLWGLRVPATPGTAQYRFLLQGTEPPTAIDIQSALDKAGIKSPIRASMDFLRQHPDHLDAKVRLLSYLRQTAEERTRQVLNLEAPTASIAPFLLVVFDTSSMDGKHLEPEQDTAIWGPYAMELQTLFANGDWRLMGLNWMRSQMPVEACSPTMVQLFQRLIPEVEAYLEEMPSIPYLWQTYGWMTSITKRGSAQRLVDKIVPPPDMQWPNMQAVSLLLSEEMPNGNWGAIAEMLWSDWPNRRRFLISGINIVASTEEQRLYMARRFLNENWRERERSLMESLIMANRIEDAETVFLDIARNPLFRDVQGMAAELALSLGRQDLNEKWLALQMPEKEKPTIVDLQIALFAPDSAPRLAVINADESGLRQIQTLLAQSRTNEWRLAQATLSPELSEFLRIREGWPEGQTHWALYHDNKILTHAPGLPTENALILELESFPTRASVLRRFISEYPSNFAAKESLIEELKRIAERKVGEKYGEVAGIDDTRTLTYEEDQDIWGEYASLYRQTLPDILERVSPNSRATQNAWSSDFYIHSPIMKSLATSYAQRAEAALIRQPTDLLLWGVWISITDLSPNRGFKDIQKALVLPPGMDITENYVAWLNVTNNTIPPSGSRARLLSRYKAKSNWKEVIDLLTELSNKLREAKTLMNTFYWSSIMQPLLEAYLHLDKTSDISDFIQFWSQTPVWPQIKQSAVDLAKNCGKETLAEQWGKL